MTTIYDVNGKWHRKAARFDPPLEKGLKLVLDAEVLNRDNATSCRLLEWRYRLMNSSGADAGPTADLELIVEEAAPPNSWESWLARWPNAQFFVPVTAGILTFFLVGGLGYTLYKQPDMGWAFAGRHIRCVGGWVVFLSFAILLPWRLGLYRGRLGLRKTFLNSFLILTALTLVFVWLAFSAPPQGFDYDYVSYARGLTERLSKSYWPLLISALPWLSVGFKLFKLDIAERVADGLEKAAPNKK
jgi:hypothetical protein